MVMNGLTGRRGLLLAGAAAFAAAPIAARATPRPDTLLSATAFGAVGDGKADDTAALQRALDETLRRAGAFLVIPPGVYRVTRTLRYAPAQATSGNIGRPNGILAHGAQLLSKIEDGSTVLEISSAAVVRFLLVEGLEILGSGKDGHGISVSCASNSAFLYNFCLRDTVVQACGGDGCRLEGNVFEGQLIDCYFRDNKGAGATFAHGKTGGIVSATHVFGAVFGQNGAEGAVLANGAYDVAFHGCYFVSNGKAGLSAANGCTMLSNCGFENNHMTAANFAAGGPGIELQSFGTLIGCTGYSVMRQTGLVRAFVAAHFVMVGCSGSGDGDAKAAYLARLGGVPAGDAIVMGSTGTIEREGDFEALEIGGAAGGIRFGAHWQSRHLPQLGEYRLWVDGEGRLRMKKGAPQSDEDGSALSPA